MNLTTQEENSNWKSHFNKHNKIGKVIKHSERKLFWKHFYLHVRTANKQNPNHLFAKMYADYIAKVWYVKKEMRALNYSFWAMIEFFSEISIKMILIPIHLKFGYFCIMSEWEASIKNSSPFHWIYFQLPLRAYSNST